MFLGKNEKKHHKKIASDKNICDTIMNELESKDVNELKSYCDECNEKHCNNCEILRRLSPDHFIGY